jgi:hypothetical protein
MGYPYWLGQIRPFKDNPALAVPVFFYQAPLTTPCYPNIFPDRFWDRRDGWLNLGIGTVVESLKPYTLPFDPGILPKSGPIGTPDQFLNGVSYADFLAGLLPRPLCVNLGPVFEMTQVDALAGVGLAAAIGTAALTQVDALAGVGLAAAIGTAALTQISQVAAYGEKAEVGTAALTQVDALAGVGLAAAIGTAALTQVDALAGEGKAGALGTAALTQVDALAGVDNYGVKTTSCPQPIALKLTGTFASLGGCTSINGATIALSYSSASSSWKGTATLPSSGSPSITLELKSAGSTPTSWTLAVSGCTTVMGVITSGVCTPFQLVFSITPAGTCCGAGGLSFKVTIVPS